MGIKKIVVGPLKTNCYLVISKNEALIIDPGDEAEKILKEIGNTQLRYIVLTHYHFDHVLVAQDLKKKTGAKILIHELEGDFIDFPVDKFFKENDEIKIGQEFLKVIHTPGHTKGSICLLGENFVFTGDTIFENGYGRTDLAGGSENDLKTSLEKLEKIVPRGIMAHPGHGSSFEFRLFKIKNF